MLPAHGNDQQMFLPMKTGADQWPATTAGSDCGIEGYEQGISQYAIFPKVKARYFASYILSEKMFTETQINARQSSPHSHSSEFIS
jgi:hypothetical protein